MKWFVDYLTDWQLGLHRWRAEYLTDLLVNWLINWLTDWLTYLLVDWLTDWQTNWMNEWMNEWLTDWLTDWLLDWLTDWLTDLLNNRPTNFLYSAEVLTSYPTVHANSRLCGFSGLVPKQRGDSLKHHIHGTESYDTPSILPYWV